LPQIKEREKRDTRRRKTDEGRTMEALTDETLVRNKLFYKSLQLGQKLAYSLDVAVVFVRNPTPYSLHLRPEVVPVGVFVCNAT
jgi:hypothetical protein